MGISIEKLKNPFHCFCAAVGACLLVLPSGHPAKAVPTAFELMQHRMARDALFSRLKAKYTFKYVVIMVPAGSIPGVDVPIPVSHIRYDSTVFFAVDKSELQGNAENAIQDFADTIMKDKSLRSILVVGHTDATGGDDYNIALSMKRATAVAARLKAVGVSDEFLHRLPMGKQQPVATNSSEDGRALNRRVEFFISDLPEASKKAVTLIPVNPCYRNDHLRPPPGKAAPKCADEEVNVPVYPGSSGSPPPDYIQLSRDIIAVAPTSRDPIPTVTEERDSLRDLISNQ